MFRGLLLMQHTNDKQLHENCYRCLLLARSVAFTLAALRTHHRHASQMLISLAGKHFLRERTNSICPRAEHGAFSSTCALTQHWYLPSLASRCLLLQTDACNNSWRLTRHTPQASLVWHTIWKRPWVMPVSLIRGATNPDTACTSQN